MHNRFDIYVRTKCRKKDTHLGVASDEKILKLNFDEAFDLFSPAILHYNIKLEDVISIEIFDGQYGWSYSLSRN